MTMATAKSWQSWVIGVLVMAIAAMTGWSWLTVDERFERVRAIQDRHAESLVRMQSHVDRSEVLLEQIRSDVAKVAAAQEVISEGSMARGSLIRQDLHVLQSKVDKLSDRIQELERHRSSGGSFSPSGPGP